MKIRCQFFAPPFGRIRLLRKFYIPSVASRESPSNQSLVKMRNDFPKWLRLAESVLLITIGGGFKYFSNFHPEPWEKDLTTIFQMG